MQVSHELRTECLQFWEHRTGQLRTSGLQTEVAECLKGLGLQVELEAQKGEVRGTIGDA